MKDIFKSYIGYDSLLISLVTISIAALLAFPIRSLLQTLIDKYFFRGTFLEIANQNEQLQKEIVDKEKFKAVATLASGIAHEIKNPLTALKAFHEHFKDNRNDPEYVAKFNHITTRELSRIENLSKQLLDFAKPSPPHFVKADINEIIKDVLDLIGNKIMANKITTDLSLPGTIFLSVDTNQMKQALLNLILNAIDAMPDGGVLKIETYVKNSGSKKHVEIIITDTGCGIAPEDLKHIFEPFYTKKDSGTGLGLAITKNIIETHEGKIEIFCDLNHGTKIAIYLKC